MLLRANDCSIISFFPITKFTYNLRIFVTILCLHSNLTPHPFISRLVTIVRFMRCCRVRSFISMYNHRSCACTWYIIFILHENVCDITIYTRSNKILSRNYFDTKYILIFQDIKRVIYCCNKFIFHRFKKCMW